MTEMRNGLQLGALAIFLVAGAGMAHGQMQGSHGTLTGQSGIESGEDKRVSSEMRERMEKSRNDDRQKRLVADTDKLLALATSLKADVDKTDKYTLSVDVIRRTEEIEKLSRSIRDRMKQ